ncbi:NAD(P)H-hydrate dehydratase [Aurantiacibacter sp. D1-12]|uniref:NAD(P)H-hydrate dehydratase n=1 Tax=Aurantiacibacter sp. D1-12 TaxID=2993658 RepID=UPI00237C65E1|nr:NAD(P)H-hydrate dehydratase [Aurantiacibacter sp. D1-12]MDE1466569.1 NAD(P)H-hydrate dehydratase [Aurantiacibacter sp. D1-12]
MTASNQILSAEQMHLAEEALIADGDTVQTLMDRAGKGAADWIWRVSGGRSVTVLCGPGNNGGDGYVIARELQDRGASVKVVAPLEPKTEAARQACEAWGDVPVVDAEGDVFVDCLFGTGLGRPLSDDLKVLLNQLASAHSYRVAVDLPSGIDSDSGELLNDSLPAYNLTLSLGAWKFAHWLMPAMERMGERRLVDIGIEPMRSAAYVAPRPRLAAPTNNAHKYSRGLVAVVAGEMPGAAMLAAGAAQHGGAGYVKVFVPDDGPDIAAPPDIVVEYGSLFEQIRDGRIDAFLIGPGLGEGDDARTRLDWVLACDLPTVCDASALGLLAPSMIEGRESPLIATPHAGELDSLANAFEATGLDRIELATELAEDIEGVLVAKGPDTLIASQGDPLSVMPSATSWLSVAGSGDVLAGLIASRLATGVSARKAAEQGCWLHKEAARRAGPVFSASQLVDSIPGAYGALL